MMEYSNISIVIQLVHFSLVSSFSKQIKQNQHQVLQFEKPFNSRKFLTPWAFELHELYCNFYIVKTVIQNE